MPDRRSNASVAVEPAKQRFGILVAGLTAAVLAFAPVAAAAAEAVAPAPIANVPVLPAAPVFGRNVTDFTLANGLEVVVIPDHRAPVVTHMVWYKIGASDEPRGKSGVAHYLEHLMFKGTKANPNGSFSSQVAAIGGQENAFTASDYTAYYQRVAKEQLGLVMRLEADRMENLILSEATARPELQVVLEERSMRTDSSPSALLGEALDAALYVNSPYHIPIIGWRHEIEKLTYKDALDFYNRFYTPNNVVLVVAGDVDADMVKRLAEETYGMVPRRAEPGMRVHPSEPEPNARRSVTYQDERVTQPSFRRAWIVPSFRTAKPGESEALEVLGEVLGSSTTSRLYRRMVMDQQLATSAGGWYQSNAWDDTKFLVYATPRDGVALSDIEQAVDKLVAEISSDGPSEAEVARAKRKLVAEAVQEQDNQATLARIFGESLATGETVAQVQTWPARIYAVDAAAVKAVAQKYLTAERGVTGLLVNGPNPAAKQLATTASRSPFPAGPIR
ncbi:MAG: pitrilysin family protein [Ancalomicrobiaceae bacterium]|nr:pitrilysin family protein [Ancalomicrobiaceae bacterium]